MKKTMRLVSILLTLCMLIGLLSVGATVASAEATRVQGAMAINWKDPDWGAGGNTWGMKEMTSWSYNAAGGVNIVATSPLGSVGGENDMKIGIPDWGCGGKMKAASQNTDGMMAKVKVNEAAINGEAVDTVTITVLANVGTGDIWYNFEVPVGEEYVLDVPFSSFASPAAAKANGMMWNEIRMPQGSTFSMWIDNVYTYTLEGGEDEGGDDEPAAVVSGTPLWNWDYYGQGWGSTVTTENLGNQIIRIKTGAGEEFDQVQFGSGGANNQWWGIVRPQALPVLDGATGLVFSIRVNNLEYSTNEAVPYLNINVKFLLNGDLGTAETSVTAPIGEDATVTVPFSVLKIGGVALTDDQIAALSTTTGQVEIDFMTPHWGWRRYKNVDVVMSSIYTYTGEGTVTGPALPAPAEAIKATFDNGVADVEADNEGNVTMPSATIEGKQFIGWQDANGALYAAGAKVAITEDTAFTAVAADIALQTGAGIRWAERETERGIRFETYVTKEALDKIGSSNFELGALILPYADYNADITVETAANYGAVNVVDPKVYGEVGENYRYYTGVVDFEKYFAVSQAALADLKLTAVSYIKVTYADATTGYFYAKPDATNNVRSVAEVARAALADTEFGYTEKQIAILNLYKQYSQEDTMPEYRKDDADKIA